MWYAFGFFYANCQTIHIYNIFIYLKYMLKIYIDRYPYERLFCLDMLECVIIFKDIINISPHQSAWKDVSNIVLYHDYVYSGAYI